MKKSLLLIALMIAVLSLSANIASVADPSFSEPSPSAECVAYAPDLPGLPEDDILYGDANDDGVTNVLDIITIVNYILGANPDPFNFEAADVNNDGVINVLDLIFDINIILETPAIPCAGMPTVIYEGQTYNTVKIGDQCWFKENLNVGTMINSNQGGPYQTDNGVIEKYCYGNNAANCVTFGGLYEWNEAMHYVTTEGAQGICPMDWHIPTDGEWTVLENYLGGLAIAGGKLKEAGFSHWNLPNTDATNESGFTALPGGFRSQYDGNFYDIYAIGYFRSSSQNSGNSAWIRRLLYTNAAVDRDYYYKDYGFSIRCLKGCVLEPSQANAGPDQLDVSGTSTTLAGNTPEYGTGLWEIVSGTGGTIVTPTSPNSEFQGLAGNEYTLSWTITTLCGSSQDEVVISFAASGSFTCGDDLVYEGQSYATVLIDTQCWMAENLNVGTKINSLGSGFHQTDNETIEKYCYNNDITYCDTYGGLYEWPEAMQYGTTEGAQGICPVGWHFPTDGEWTILTDFLGGETVAGGKMKSTGTIEDGTGLWHEPNEGATNESGFTGFPGGNRDWGEGDFWDLGLLGGFWSSSQYDTVDAWLRTLSKYHTVVTRYDDSKESGLSLRCLKDD